VPRFYIAWVFCLAVCACVPSEPAAKGAGFAGYGTTQTEAIGPTPRLSNYPRLDGWTVVEGPVRYDDSRIVGRLTIFAKGNFRQAELSGPGASKASGKWYISRNDLASAFRSGMEARTGCRAASSVEFSSISGGIVGLKMLLNCG
jgi:hypothetical protein